MTYNTIDNDVTIAGGAEGALLANRYRIVRQLGQGGMGSVWLAEDTQLDNKQFAIKMLPSILVSNRRAYNQLKDEALVAMRLVHPNIVQIRAFEENYGNPFLVMDYIDGQTLDDYLAEKGKLSEDETIKLLKPIAAALDYAHGEGVVHRDVKPANVMIRKDGHPYILDFGIAREIQETMTRVTGKLSSGTLLYMSPEQLHGTAPKKEQDVYSFAAMAYECLKGEPPFSRGQIEYQIDHDMPEPLVDGDGPIAPLAIGVMAGLSKKPEDRPPTCTEVLERGDIARKREEDEAERKRREEAERRALADLDSSDRKDIVLSHKGDGSRHSFNGARGYLMAICTAIAVLAAIVIYVGSYSPKTRQRLDKRELVKSDYIHRLEKEAAERRAEAERREREVRETDGNTANNSDKARIQASASKDQITIKVSDNCQMEFIRNAKGGWIAKSPVSWREYVAVVGMTPVDVLNYDTPATNVTVEDCELFLQKLARRARLPNSSELGNLRGMQSVRREWCSNIASVGDVVLAPAYDFHLSRIFKFLRKSRNVDLGFRVVLDE